MSRNKRFIIIFIWFPFVFSFLIVLFIVFNKAISVNLKNPFDLSAFEKILNINFPESSERFNNKIKIRQKTWNPFLGKFTANLSVDKRVPKKKLYLSAIFSTAHKKVCIINGHMYALNSKIDGIKILQIFSDHVVLNFSNGKRVVLHVGEQILY